VFYLVPYTVQEHLIAVCAQKLEAGGVIVLKEMSEVPRWKLRLAIWEEKLAVNVLRITATTEGGTFTSARAPIGKPCLRNWASTSRRSRSIAVTITRMWRSSPKNHEQV
jgi:hypothetical protein